MVCWAVNSGEVRKLSRTCGHSSSIHRSLNRMEGEGEDSIEGSSEMQSTGNISCGMPKSTLMSAGFFQFSTLPSVI